MNDIDFGALPNDGKWHSIGYGLSATWYGETIMNTATGGDGRV